MRIFEMPTAPITESERFLRVIHERETAKLRARIDELERQAKAETDEPGDEPAPKTPDIVDASGDDDMVLDPETGKLRPKKKNAKAADDDAPNDDRDAPDKAIPTDAKAFALMIVNSGLRARGRKPISRLAQDEEILPGGVVPTDPEQFARAVINAGRKARAQSPLAPGEFISIKELRGGR
jgi:hypothetical protein